MTRTGSVEPPHVTYAEPGRLATGGVRRPPGGGRGRSGSGGGKEILPDYEGHRLLKQRTDDYLNQFRGIRFISPEEMAAKIGLPVDRWRAVSNREAYPSPHEAEVFAEFFGGTTKDNFLDGVPEPKPQPEPRDEKLSAKIVKLRGANPLGVQR